MKVSVIIPVYNVEPYIERCLLSALNQTYQDIEIILVDDCGQDNSMAVAQQIIDNHPNGYKARVLKHEHNRGLSAARNTGTKEAGGEYVYYLDSDDEITPYCIEVVLDLASKYQGVEMVQGNTQTIPVPSKEKDWRNILYKGFPEYVNDNKWIYLHFYDVKKKLIPMNGTNKLVKRKFVLDNDLFFKEGIIHEDELWMFGVVKKLNTIAFTTEYTYIAYKRVGSIMQSNNNYKSVQSWYVILKEIFNDFNDPFFEDFNKKYIRKLYGQMYSINLDTNESELYYSYKRLVKDIIGNLLKRKKIMFTLPLYILLMPPFVYKYYVGKKSFGLFIKLVK
jgi:glycosyltransferase involved in cell wall biosynthesis